MSEHLEFERDVRERIKQAMRYPIFVLVAMVIAVIILNIFVIPVFAKVFAGFHAELPLITRGLLAFSGWMLAWWPLLLAAAVAAVALLRAYLRTPNGRYRWDARKLKLPIVGEIVLKATLARFARSFALSSQSGVPLVQALTVVAQTVDNTFIGSRIEQMRDGIERGESISRCAAATGVFTPVGAANDRGGRRDWRARFAAVRDCRHVPARNRLRDQGTVGRDRTGSAGHHRRAGVAVGTWRVPAALEHGTGRHGQGRRLNVARDWVTPQEVPFWTRRMMEWTIRAASFWCCCWFLAGTCRWYGRRPNVPGFVPRSAPCAQRW